MISLIDLLKNKINNFVLKHDEKPWENYYGKIPKHLEYPKFSIYELLEKTVSKYPKYIA